MKNLKKAIKRGVTYMLPCPDCGHKEVRYLEYGETVDAINNYNLDMDIDVACPKCTNNNCLTIQQTKSGKIRLYWRSND